MLNQYSGSVADNRAALLCTASSVRMLSSVFEESLVGNGVKSFGKIQDKHFPLCRCRSPLSQDHGMTVCAESRRSVICESHAVHLSVSYVHQDGPECAY